MLVARELCVSVNCEKAFEFAANAVQKFATVSL